MSNPTEKRSLNSEPISDRKRKRVESSESFKKKQIILTKPPSVVEGAKDTKTQTQQRDKNLPSFVLTKSSHAILTTDLDVINKLNYRNKNQHRVTKWWKWFDLLRRHLRMLLKSYDGKDYATAKERADYLKNWVVPGAYVSFSRGLVAAKSWAGLGILLLGILSRVHGALASKEEIDELIAETILMNQLNDSKKEQQQLVVDDLGETLERNMDDMDDFDDMDDDMNMDDFTMHEEPITIAEFSVTEENTPYKEESWGTESTVEPIRSTIHRAGTPTELSSDKLIGKPKKKPKKVVKDEEGTRKKKKKKGRLDDLFAGLV